MFCSLPEEGRDRAGGIVKLANSNTNCYKKCCRLDQNVTTLPPFLPLEVLCIYYLF